ncbi:MAG: hypothetical protein AB8I08_06100 [Sandaracinaceae bacterium]
MRPTAMVLLATLALLPSSAMAQDDEPEIPLARSRPTSGEPSFSSGRTLGVGETMIGAAAGWPWIWAEAQYALDSSFNIGVRAALLYGSSVMALEPAVGGELSVPMRIHLFGEDVIDLAAYVTPTFSLGEGGGVGEGGNLFSGDLGWSSRLEVGGLLGWRAAERLTLLVGLGGQFGFVHTPAAGDPELMGGVLARLGLEGLISRDTMLFALLEGGLGFAPSRGVALFRGESFPPILRISLGIAYLL